MELRAKIFSRSKPPEKFPEQGSVRPSQVGHLGTTTRCASDRALSCIARFRLFSTLVHFLHWYFAGASNATALYMWRSNVLSLRQCSSAGRLRRGVNSRWYGSTTSSPITEKEFEDALQVVLPRRWALRRGDGQRVSSLGTSNLTNIRIGTDCRVQASLSVVEPTRWHLLLYMLELGRPMHPYRKAMALLSTTKCVQRVRKKLHGLPSNCAPNVSRTVSSAQIIADHTQLE